MAGISGGFDRLGQKGGEYLRVGGELGVERWG